MKGRRTQFSRASSLVALGLLGLAACGPDAGSSRPETRAPEPPPDRIGLGTVEGVVRLAPGTTLPTYGPRELGIAPGATTPEHCSPARITDRQPVQATADGLLAGVMVTATGDPEHFYDSLPEVPPREHAVTIEDCRLGPRLVAATRGDFVRITNRDAHPFLPRLGESPFMQALLQGQGRTFPLDRGGVQFVGCGFAGACGRTDIVVVHHDVHTITGADGHFRMENVPADQEVVLHVWHPLFVENQLAVTVERGGSRTVELAIAPAVPAPVEPGPGDPSPDAGPAESQPGVLF